MRRNMLSRTGAACRAIIVAGAVLHPSLDIQAVAAQQGAHPSIAREVRPGDRLEVESYAGKVTLSAWDRNEVIVAAAGTAEEILVERSGSRVHVTPASWAKDAPAFEVRLPDMARVRVVGKPPRLVDLDVRAPAWMPITIEGPFIDVSLAGFDSAIEIVVVGGTVELKSTTGPVSVVALGGAILVEDSTGPLTLGGGETALTVLRSSGDLRAETTIGDIRLEALRSARAEVTTVGGDISWLGALARDGFYDLSTHAGDIHLRLPGQPDARFSVRTYRGRIESNLAAPAGQPSDRLEFTSGEGRGTVRLMSFAGTTRVDADQDPAGTAR